MQTLAVDGRVFAWPAPGLRRYVRELYGAIHRIDPALRLVAIGAGVDVAVPEGVERHAAPGLLPTNLGWQLAGLPSAVWRLKPDVLHAPAYTAPLWGRTPVVVTIHDVSYARHPEWYPYPVDPFRRAFYRASACRAARIVTDSEFSKREIAAAYLIDESRIDVVPLAAAGTFLPDPSVGREMFVLHVGDLHKRRNLPMLLDIVIELSRTTPALQRLRLVVAGIDRGELDSLRTRAQTAGAAHVLEHVGGADDGQLAALYRRAAVFAYPSRYEGFGLPVVEAMACGTPVVATTAGSVPEVTGDAALLCDPEDARSWREALGSVLRDPARGATMSDASLQRAACFTWERTARMTLESFARARSRA